MITRYCGNGSLVEHFPACSRCHKAHRIRERRYVITLDSTMKIDQELYADDRDFGSNTAVGAESIVQQRFAFAAYLTASLAVGCMKCSKGYLSAKKLTPSKTTEGSLV